MAVKKPTKTQLAYWEQRLREYGLGMDVGRNTNKLVYGWEYSDCDGRNQTRRNVSERVWDEMTSSERADVEDGLPIGTWERRGQRRDY